MSISRRPSRSEVLLAATPSIVAVMGWFAGRDPFEAPKLAITSLLFAGLAGAAMVRAGRQGTVTWIRSPWTASVGFFLLVAGVAVLTADNSAAAFFGVPSRQIGWLLYASAGGLGLLTAASSDGIPLARLFRRAMLIVLVVLGVYGVLQLLGADPFPVSSSVSGVFVTLSNPNFAGAWGGALLGLAGLAAIDASLPRWERAMAVAGVVASAVLVVGAASVVGVVAAGVSAAVGVVIWLLGRSGSFRRVGLPVVGGLAGVAAVLGGLGTFEMGPLARLGEATGVVLRRFYWEAALAMAGDQPMTGVGFDRFVRFYRSYRSPAAAARDDVTIETDAAHSVPLHLLSGGGVPLLLVWLVLIAVGAWAAVRAVRAAQSDGRLLVGGVASVWAAVTVQSLASFDVAALLVLSFVCAGILAGLAWPDATTSVALPGSTVEAVVRRKRTTTTTRPPAWAVPLAWTLAGVLVAGALLVGTKPFRAELAANTGQEALAAGRTDLVDRAWSRAGSIAPWEVDYPYREGLGLLQLGALEDGVEAFGRALDIQPDHVGSLVSRGRALAALQRRDEAREDYLTALEFEPNHLDLKVEVALYIVDSDRGLAEDLLAEVEARNPDHGQLEVLRERLALTPGD
ncbi:MAG: O-antigen ligase family protein [Actinomycetota bacterium]